MNIDKIEFPDELKLRIQYVTREAIGVIQFLTDAGSYKDRQKYKLTQVEIAQRIHEITGNLIETVVDNTIATYLFEHFGTKNQGKIYEKLKTEADETLLKFVEKNMGLKNNERRDQGDSKDTSIG